MERGPAPIAGRSDRQGDAPDHRADHRDLAGAAVGVRAGGLHPRACRASLFRQFAVTISFADADLGDQRADPVAGAVRGVPAPPRHARADRSAGCWAASTGCATATPRVVHAAGARRGARPRAGGRGRGAAQVWLSAHTPTGFLPEEDQGAFFVAIQLPDGASVARSAAVATRVDRHAARRCRRSQRHAVDHRLLAARRGRAGTERRLHGRASEAVRRPHRRRRTRCRR